MTFTKSPQTIYQSEDGEVRIVAFLGVEDDLVVIKQIYDVADEQSVLPVHWHSIEDTTLDHQQAIAVRMAIDTYLETPLPPALQQTGIEMAKEAWAVLQAANRLVGYCRSVRLDTKLSPDPDDGELKCWQMEGWCLGLLEEADRVAALIDGVVEPIEPVPPTGGNPIKYDAKHFAAPGIDLLVEFGEESLTNTPTWAVSDKFGEVIYLELAGLTWLAELFPRILESYRSHSAAMEGGSNDS
jgi:hypothetical protein